jgi:dipeptidyl aminopeptidase/acylaminoacyl peptidase
MASYSPFTPSKLDGLRFRLKACAALCPATDLTSWKNPVIVQYLQDGDEDFGDELKSASPINYSRTAIPTLLEHGTSDRVVPFAQSVQMASALKRSGIKVRFVKLENSGHDFIIQPGQNKDTAMREIVQFFNKNLTRHG